MGEDIESKAEKEISHDADVDRGIIFLETLRRSAEMAQELFNANHEMSLQLKSLEADLASKQARVTFLERETQQLRAGLSRLAVANDKDRMERFETIFEDQNVLAHLFITSDRLSRVSSPIDAIAATVEVLHNLVGAKRYGMWLRWKTVAEPRLVVSDGVEASQCKDALALANAAMDRRRPTQPEGQSTDLAPIAFPLKLGRDVVGALVVVELVPQRPKLERLHRDLLNLLSERLGQAFCVGAVYDQMTREQDLWGSLQDKLSEVTA